MNLLEDAGVEVRLLIGPDGRARTYFTNDLPREDVPRVAAAIIRAGLWLAESHGLEVLGLGPVRTSDKPGGQVA